MENELEIMIDGRSIPASELNELLPEGYQLVETANWVPRSELVQAQCNREIDLALTRSGARNLTAARALLPQDLEVTDPKAVNEAIDRLKRENDWMFRSETPRASGHTFAPKPSVDFSAMSDKEYYEYRKQQKTH